MRSFVGGITVIAPLFVSGVALAARPSHSMGSHSHGSGGSGAVVVAVIVVMLVSTLGFIVWQARRAKKVMEAAMKGAVDPTPSLSPGFTPSGPFAPRAAQSRIRGIALVVSASSVASETAVNGERFERRSVEMDIEIPGQAPYTVSARLLIPRLCDALPGSSLEVLVDPQDSTDIVVVGPPGTSEWLSAWRSFQMSG